ncbi:MAG: DUF4058 family protein [Planctomycetaceae bacterium]
MPIHDWTRVAPGIFHAFHQKWVGSICDALNAGLLPNGFYALEEQVAGGPKPDVLTLERIDELPFPNTGGAGSAVALAEHPPRVRHTVETDADVYARTADRVAIRHVSGHRVVAFVEVVSRGNKVSAVELLKFLKKLREAIENGCHLLVIDLHPPGRHDPDGIPVAFWDYLEPDEHGVTAEQPFSLAAYRATVGPTAYIELVGIGQVLPEMPLFLTPDYYVNVPLEATYVSAYQRIPQLWRNVLKFDRSEEDDSGCN